MPTLTHDQLAHDLAVSLSRPLDPNPEIGRPWGKYMTWENLQMRGGSRPDVLAIRAVHNHGHHKPTTFEVKVSVADFRADVRAEKWKKYFRFSSRVVFAVPEGLIDESEIPEGAGLIVRRSTGYGTKRDQPGWRWIIKPPCKPNPLEMPDYINLVLKCRNLYPYEVEEVKTGKKWKRKPNDSTQ